MAEVDRFLEHHRTAAGDDRDALDWLVEHAAGWTAIGDPAVQSLSVTGALADSGLRALHAFPEQAATRLVEVLAAAPADPTPLPDALTLLARDHPSVHDYLATFVATAHQEKGAITPRVLQNLGHNELVADTIVRSLRKTDETAGLRQAQAARLAGVIRPESEAVRTALAGLLQAPEWIIRYEATLALRRLGADDDSLRETLNISRNDPITRVRQIVDSAPQVQR